MAAVIYMRTMTFMRAMGRSGLFMGGMHIMVRVSAIWMLMRLLLVRMGKMFLVGFVVHTFRAPIPIDWDLPAPLRLKEPANGSRVPVC